MYKYAHGKPDSAFASITGCARMAYAAGIRQHARDNCEEANTWWATVIYERYAWSSRAQIRPLTILVVSVSAM